MGRGGNKQKAKAYSIEVIRVGDKSDEIMRSIVKREIKKVLEKNGVIAYNLDDVLTKYITEETCNEQKEEEKSSLRTRINVKGNSTG
ncbi:hypothetical protein [Paenibacillus sp. UNCCL117]|uniref:hypothetical protein n=2 Tax=unclassified Paenibacillus TaxID=185978 RepID=UPI001160956D|nr:hypothetical protein [Paenibacillus sp. UNCCL117]